AVPVATDVTRVDVWADANGRDPRRLRRLNPAFVAGRIRHDGGAVHLLVPTPAYAALVVDEAPDAETQPAIARAEGAESTVNGSPTQARLAAPPATTERRRACHWAHRARGGWLN